MAAKKKKSDDTSIAQRNLTPEQRKALASRNKAKGGMGKTASGEVEKAGRAAYKKATGKSFKGTALRGGQESYPRSGGAAKGLSKAQRDYIDSQMMKAFRRFGGSK